MIFTVVAIWLFGSLTFVAGYCWASAMRDGNASSDHEMTIRLVTFRPNFPSRRGPFHASAPVLRKSSRRLG